jgi:hypothetical protein
MNPSIDTSKLATVGAWHLKSLTKLSNGSIGTVGLISKDFILQYLSRRIKHPSKNPLTGSKTGTAETLATANFDFENQPGQCIMNSMLNAAIPGSAAR